MPTRPRRFRCPDRPASSSTREKRKKRELFFLDSTAAGRHLIHLAIHTILHTITRFSFAMAAWVGIAICGLFPSYLAGTRMGWVSRTRNRKHLYTQLGGNCFLGADGVTVCITVVFRLLSFFVVEVLDLDGIQFSPFLTFFGDMGRGEGVVFT